LKKYAPEGALVLAAFLFGVTFPLVHDALDDIHPFAYLLLRFGFAVVALGPFLVVGLRRCSPQERRMLGRVSVVAGVLLFGGYATQTVGLETASPSRSAFITGLYVVLTPIVEAIVRRRAPAPVVLIGIACATVGLYLLTGADLHLGTGELWTLACAVLFAVWIVYQGEHSHRLPTLPFTTLQMIVLLVLCAPATAAEGLGELTGLALFAAAFTGVACSSVALSLQVWGQRRISASRTALILLLEPVFAAIAGYVNGERLGTVELVGALVILGGIGLAELGPGRAQLPMPETVEPHPF
jgi:drug/metabolite transporter (DMT)-like permease